MLESRIKHFKISTGFFFLISSVPPNPPSVGVFEIKIAQRVGGHLLGEGNLSVNIWYLILFLAHLAQSAR